MKKFLCLILTIIMVIGLLVIPAEARISDGAYPDVVISRITDGKNLPFFPDIVKLPDGKLILAYFKNDVHVPRTVAQVTNATIEWVESTDNGVSWTAPKTFIDQNKLKEWGLSTDAEPVQARDPNFALLPDGTLVFTFFTAQYGGDKYTRPYITTSFDNGKNWAKPELIPCDEFTLWYAKRGDIAVFDDGYMLIPIYGEKIGNSKDRAINILVKYTRDGGFEWENRKEYELSDEDGKELTEVSVVTAVDGETVYAFARPTGKLYESSDRGANWTQIADIGGEIDNIHQPGLKLMPDGSIFATWSKKASDGRPVYAKLFYPELGWDATKTMCVYAPYTNVGDMGDPSGVLLDNGKLFVIYYDYYDAIIGGTFIDYDELAYSGETKFTLPNAVYAIEGVPTNIKADVFPKEKSSEILWSSDNTSVATVENGIATPVSAGKATITATVDGVSAETEFVVTEAGGFSENFNNLTPNAHPAGWSHNGASSDTCHARTYDDNGEKVLRVLDRSTTSAPINVIKSFPLADTVVASFDYKMISAGYTGTDNAPQGANMLGLLNGGYIQATNGRVVLYVMENKDGVGTLYYYHNPDGNGYNVVLRDDIKKGEWYHVEIEMVTGSDKVKLTFGDEEYFIPVLGRRTTADMLWFASNSKGTDNDEFMIDNVVVRTNVLPEKYAVKFDCGSAEGVPPVKANTEAGDTFFVPGCSMSNYRHKFYGWYDGEKIYKAGEIFTMPAKNVTFTAMWRFDAFDGEESEDFTSMIIGGTPTGWKNNGVNTDVCHARVYSDNGNNVLRVLDNGASTVNILCPFTKAKTLRADFKFKTQGMNQYGNGFGLMNNNTFSHDAVTLRLVPENGGTTGKLMYYNKGAKETCITGIKLNKWYDVSIEILEGSSAATIIFGDQIAKIDLINGTGTEASYFWVGSAGGAETGDDYLIDDIKILTKTNKDKYSVTYLAGEGATGTVPTQEDTEENSIFTLPTANLTKPGYKFAGWISGNRIVKAGEDFTMPAEDTTFTAIWQFDGFNGLVEDDFSDKTAGQHPYGWNHNGVNNDLCHARVYDDEGNNVLHVYDEGAQSPNILRSFTQVKTLRTEFKFKTHAMTGNGVGLMNTANFTHDTVTLRVVPEDNGVTGKLQYYKSGTKETGITGIEKDKWYDISIEMVEGESVATVIFGDKIAKIDLINGAGSSACYFWAGSAGGSTTGDDFMIDDVKIYTKTKTFVPIAASTIENGATNLSAVDYFYIETKDAILANTVTNDKIAVTGATLKSVEAVGSNRIKISLSGVYSGSTCTVSVDGIETVTGDTVKDSVTFSTKPTGNIYKLDFEGTEKPSQIQEAGTIATSLSSDRAYSGTQSLKFNSVNNYGGYAKVWFYGMPKDNIYRVSFCIYSQNWNSSNANKPIFDTYGEIIGTTIVEQTDKAGWRKVTATYTSSQAHGLLLNLWGMGADTIYIDDFEVKTAEELSVCAPAMFRNGKIVNGISAGKTTIELPLNISAEQKINATIAQYDANGKMINVDFSSKTIKADDNVLTLTLTDGANAKTTVFLSEAETLKPLCSPINIPLANEEDMLAESLEGKNFSILGDSISSFDGYSNNTSYNTTLGVNDPCYSTTATNCIVTDVNETWWMQSANKTGMKLLVNNSWAGDELSSAGTPGKGLVRAAQLHSDTGDDKGTKPDVIAVYIGTNDIRSMEGTSKFTQDYTSLINILTTEYPDAEIFFFTCLPIDFAQINVDSYNDVIRNLVNNSSNNKLHLVDLYAESGITSETQSTYQFDKLHPNLEGMDRITDVFIDAMIKALVY